jgi:hypothetical protein
MKYSPHFWIRRLNSESANSFQINKIKYPKIDLGMDKTLCKTKYGT